MSKNIKKYTLLNDTFKVRGNRKATFLVIAHADDELYYFAPAFYTEMLLNPENFYLIVVTNSDEGKRKSRFYNMVHKLFDIYKKNNKILNSLEKVPFKFHFLNLEDDYNKLLELDLLADKLSNVIENEIILPNNTKKDFVILTHSPLGEYGAHWHHKAVSCVCGMLYPEQTYWLNWLEEPYPYQITYSVDSNSFHDILDLLSSYTDRFQEEYEHILPKSKISFVKADRKEAIKVLSQLYYDNIEDIDKVSSEFDIFGFETSEKEKEIARYVSCLVNMTAEDLYSVRYKSDKITISIGQIPQVDMCDISQNTIVDITICLVDIGSHNGDKIFQIGKNLCSSVLDIICVEPNQFSFDVLKSKCDEFNYKNPYSTRFYTYYDFEEAIQNSSFDTIILMINSYQCMDENERQRLIEIIKNKEHIVGVIMVESDKEAFSHFVDNIGCMRLTNLFTMPFSFIHHEKIKMSYRYKSLYPFHSQKVARFIRNEFVSL